MSDSLIEPAASTETTTTDTTQTDSPFDFSKPFGENWIDSLPDGLKEHKDHFSKFQNPLQVLESNRNLQQMLGKKGDAVVIPDATADRKAWEPVLKKMGVPDTPEGYGLKIPEGLPEGVKINEAELQEFGKLAHEIGLTPQQLQKLQQFDIARAGKAVEMSAGSALEIERQEFENQKSILTKEWGNGQEAVQKNALALRAALTLGFAPEEVTGDNADPLFRNAKFVMAMHKMGTLMSEDTLVKGENVNTGGSWLAKAQDATNNPQNPMYAKYWAQDPETVKTVTQWFQNGSR